MISNAVILISTAEPFLPEVNKGMFKDSVMRIGNPVIFFLLLRVATLKKAEVSRSLYGYREQSARSVFVRKKSLLNARGQHEMTRRVSRSLIMPFDSSGLFNGGVGCRTSARRAITSDCVVASEGMYLCEGPSHALSRLLLGLVEHHETGMPVERCVLCAERVY